MQFVTSRVGTQEAPTVLYSKATSTADEAPRGNGIPL